ncbi:hypothetical protein [Campylobacter fetus]|uniref:hypothetical protein n=1 Tax=Campylobacter fetus TaxID=196 RepID=UPI000FCBC4C1|nr:hypothetical protein [Campylobacter fetus]RUT50967.1 hypothetical protein BWK67_00140 [Campylobacter fetus]RUT51695.1 hypothetical protein BWK51_00140 [Campylobacter fetus]
MFNTGFTGYFADILELEMDLGLYKIAKEAIIDKVEKEQAIIENYKNSDNTDQEVEIELTYAKDYWKNKNIEEYCHFNTVVACKELSNLQNTLKVYKDHSTSKDDMCMCEDSTSALDYIDLLKDHIIEVNLPEKSNHTIVLNYVKNIIKEFLNSDLEILLGIMLKKDNQYVNLTHPLSLSNYIKRSKDYKWGVINSVSKLYVYYTTKEKALEFSTSENKILTPDIRKKLEEDNYLENTLGDVIALYRSKLTSPQIVKFKKNLIEELPQSIVFLNLEKYSLDTKLNLYCDEAFLNIDESIPASVTNYLIPVDRIATNLIFPYYGNALITLTQKSDSSNYTIKGKNLSPMLSCNLSNSVQDTLVCTGEYKSNTLEGLETLCIANLSSPYHKCGGTYKTLDWIAMNIDVAYNIIDKEIGVNHDNRTI